MTQTIFDAVVIGSGASGSMAAKELTERGLDVALIEAGRDITPEDLAAARRSRTPIGIQLWQRAVATLSGQHVQAKVPFFNRDLSSLFVNDRDHPYTTTKEQPFLWVRGRQLGGRLHIYGRVLMRWSDCDFRAGDLDGKSENWPISYADLAPHYDALEQFFGVFGTKEGIPNLPDGQFVAPSKLNGYEESFKSAVEAKWPGRHVVPWRYELRELAKLPKSIVVARATGKLTTFVDSIARRILTEKSGAVASGVEVVDRNTMQTSEVRGRVVMVCCSPVETSRLLLNSASKDHPDGLGNSSGALGRYFMDQVPSFISGTVTPEFKGSSEMGVQGGAYIPRWYNTDVAQTQPDFARGFAYQGEIGRLFRPEGREAPFAFMGFGELLPYADNRITLHPRARDRWGMPIPHIRCWMGDNERTLLRRQTEEIKAMTEAAGLEVQWIGSPLGLQEFGKGAYPHESALSRFMFRRLFRGSMTIGGAIHESGGARMGNDPKTSVLNSRNQSWDVENLFVTDASSFVTSGTSGTTLTIMALTRRASEFIANGMKA